VSTGTALPTSSEELEELFNTPTQLNALYADGKLGDAFSAYRKAMTASTQKQLKDEVAAGIHEWLQANNGGQKSTKSEIASALAAAQAAKPLAVKNKLYRAKAAGSVLNGEPLGQSWGAFLNAIHHKRELTDEVGAFRKSIKNAMSERVPSDGGFLVPETLRSDMLMLSLEKAVVRGRARTIPMDSLRVPYPTIDDPSHTSSVFGGVIGYWTEEAAALTASQPAFGRVVLEAKKLTGYTEIPNELLEDSIAALDQFFSEMFPEALAWFEDIAFLSGDGVGNPQGVYNGTAGINVTRNTSNEVLLADIVAMYTRMLPQSLNTAVWLCSPAVIAQLLQLVLISGTTPVAPPLWLNQMQVNDAPVYTLLGRPLIVSEKIPNLGTRGDLAFVDFGYYLIGDRQQMQVSSSEDYKFANDLTAFRVIERLDGRPWLRSALTPENGGSTLSPFVFLQ
jgi:HK97 family phage major capsid protein